ncbi:hypothetical protein F441_13417 [Phytophthora nicotianae CJ01A1]|uniref:Uncharacterized protein n=6 Tax=Phytophthora nicotianae TaxID=4792 RepID=W2R7H2_PHYN3|nr:hypothetical protein PPTG_03464 [Phytophthora nicotianae INRA-310]ETI41277.1 hypothetical protein F443_13481 [Phytophthora nicotianae P1569]ETK81326.1 hypothetical protein L915_13175 [Phytophthora nicotianae]ETO69942.1 hypothetical protein F444_13543 [Phytophthora nicotianae P1976]ETP11066.1 hypothetical protein F441_13417 [Phytophthora nicotianae CJ01A1]ETP39173.1 hypothetical protein F442_13351 [Phytophthora nicotianae P10297]KUF84421.1 hypothetical protein AM587_10008308 [Phytophthora n
MSSEVQEDVEMATLEELFEFIDCCVCPDVFTENIDTSDPWCEHAMLPPLEFSTTTAQGSPTTIDRASRSPESNAPATKPKRRRKRTGWSSSTGLQRRKRAELQFLREHVRDLEEYAERLKKRVGLTSVEDELTVNWQEIAAVEYAERQKAEDLNRNLRRVMDNQLQLSAAFKRMTDQNALV